MKEHIEQRLQTLETEYQNGRRMLVELESKEAAVRGNLLRLSGAIQILRELLPAKTEVEPAAETAEIGKPYAVAG